MMREIDCHAPEGNAFAIMSAVADVLHSQGVPNEVIHEFIVAMASSSSYFELLDAAITITEGQISFVNAPRRH